MERWWGKRYDRSALEKLYGDLEANALLATLERGKAHEQVVAMYWLGKQNQVAALSPLVEHLGHEYPLLRFFARDAVERLSGRELSLDLHAPVPQILQSARSQLAKESR
jgi:hypothetical protein